MFQLPYNTISVFTMVIDSGPDSVGYGGGLLLSKKGKESGILDCLFGEIMSRFCYNFDNYFH